MPNRWARAAVAQSLFNRIVEYRLEVKSMASKGGVWDTLASEFQQYETALNVRKRTVLHELYHHSVYVYDLTQESRGKRC